MNDELFAELIESIKESGAIQRGELKPGRQFFVGQWIPVEERLPEIPSYVLVYEDGAMRTCGYDKHGFTDWDHNPVPPIDYGSITKWMPLPD